MDEELDADEMENEEGSFEGFDTDEIEADDEETENINTIGPLFDTRKMMTVVDSVGRIVVGDEKETLRFWVEKCLLTERYKYKAYSTDFGVEIEEIIRSNYDREVAESEVLRAITEALTVDERIIEIEEFELKWTGDGAHVTFIVDTIYGGAYARLMAGGDDSAREAHVNIT